jgi:uncharacterized protein (TIGR00730 family)
VRNLSKLIQSLGSSNFVKQIYYDETIEIAKKLAQNNITIVYGGYNGGMMGKLAQTALEHKGKVIGVYPSFFKSRQDGCTELIITETMHERKKIMMERSDASIALPGGIGTFEELLEAITWNKLKLNPKPVFIGKIEFC